MQPALAQPSVYVGGALPRSGVGRPQNPVARPTLQCAFMRLRSFAFYLCACALFASDTAYQKPPRAILDVLGAPATPQAAISPSRDWIVLRRARPHPPIADLARPILRLAGLRIDPSANALSSTPYDVDVTLIRVSDGKRVPVTLPPQPRITNFEFSPDGTHFAFLHRAATGTELWCGETVSGSARRLPRVMVSAVVGQPVRWMQDNRTLLVQTVPTNRGRTPAAPAAPDGPATQESSGRRTGVRTHEDLLHNRYDEALLDYYAAAQLAAVDRSTGVVTPLGKPGLLYTVAPASDGRHLLVVRLVKPYSYLHRYSAFPKEVEVWNRSGALVHKVARLALDDAPIDDVARGPRQYHWKPGEPPTLVWLESTGRGDRILSLPAPFTGQPVEIARTPARAMSLQWTESGAAALVSESNRARQTTRTLVIRPGTPGEPREIFARNRRDAYRNPGMFVSGGRRGGGGVVESGGNVFLTGQGSSPDGDHPFLDSLDLATLQTRRIFVSAPDCLETVVGLLKADGSQFLTRRETATQPPNFYVRAAGSSEARALTSFTDPVPILRKISRQVVAYTRPDGVKLSFTLYLPPGYQPGTRLPTIVWAYPREFDDADTASQMVGSPHRFTVPAGASHLLFPLHGYAVLDGATMPVVGQGEKANDTYIEQVVASAKAAIDKAAEMGVTDPERVGVGGHSYGAFMTANLLAHSDLFRAGVARSGAYNRTLTPFGFQSERRTLWKAQDVYLKMSPFLYAHKVNEPLLLIHGEADDNDGTFPIQSERMYQAVRGNGGTVRLVMLPHEAHTYRARETIEHVMQETLAWFDRHVKDAPPRKK
jgi:dipeptidyl aminopeptidase/acylaminoacyl peptidase